MKGLLALYVKMTAMKYKLHQEFNILTIEHRLHKVEFTVTSDKSMNNPALAMYLHMAI